jgi:hypothetical protein
MQVRKFAYSAFLLSTALYILLPTPDELVVFPVSGMFFSIVFHMPLVYGVLIAVIIYHSVGVVCLLGALLIGGKPIYHKLKQKFGGRMHGGPYRI